jgi:hypothetical protein
MQVSFNAAVGAQQALHGPQSEEWIISATVAGSASAGTITAATIQRQAIAASQNQQQCPFREVWALQRIYFVGTNPTPDCQLVILVDQVSQPYQPLASSVNLSQNRPAALSNQIFVNSGSVVTAQIVNFAANGSTAGVAVTFKVQTLRQAP